MPEAVGSHGSFDNVLNQSEEACRFGIMNLPTSSTDKFTIVTFADGNNCVAFPFNEGFERENQVPFGGFRVAGYF